MTTPRTLPRPHSVHGAPSLDAITLKSPAELDAMRRAGRAAGLTLEAAAKACTAGATTASVDAAARDAMVRLGAHPLFLGYRQGRSPPFPAAVCVSVNEEVVHGVPGPRVLEPGDAVSIDVGLRLHGWCADAARTVVVRPPPGTCADASLRERLEGGERLIRATRAILDRAIELMRPGSRWSSIAQALEASAEATGYGIVTEYVGHGIGRELHEAPKAPAYRSGFVGDDFVLRPGLVLAVEPMLTAGRGTAPPTGRPTGELPAWRMPVRLKEDGWTVVTIDGSIACHEEHVVAITEQASEVLTRA